MGQVFVVELSGYSDDCQGGCARELPEELHGEAKHIEPDWAKGEGLVWKHMKDSQGEYDPIRIVAYTPSGDEVRLYLRYEDHQWPVTAFGFVSGRVEVLINPADYEEED